MGLKLVGGPRDGSARGGRGGGGTRTEKGSLKSVREPRENDCCESAGEGGLIGAMGGGGIRRGGGGGRGRGALKGALKGGLRGALVALLGGSGRSGRLYCSCAGGRGAC